MEDLRLEEVCRLCLTKRKDLQLALEVGAIDRLFDCASVQIPSDSLICEICKNEVDKWYSFKQQVLKSIEVAQHLEEQRKQQKSTPQNDYLMVEQIIIKTENYNELEEIEVKPDISQITSLNLNNQADSEKICSSKKKTFKCNYEGQHHNKPKPPVTTKETPKIKEEIKYQCDLCHKSFNSKLGIMWHKQLHSALRLDSSKSTVLFSCPCCPMIYEKKPSLVDHIKWKHPHYLKRSTQHDFCDICGHFCKSKLDLKTHLKSHMKEIQLPCEMCNKSYTSVGSLVLHRRVHKNNNLTCKYCQRMFLKEKSLRDHEATHERRHKCPKCSKSFIYGHTLKKHMEFH